MKKVIFTLALIFTAVLFSSCEPESLIEKEPLNQNTFATDIGKDELTEDDI